MIVGLLRCQSYTATAFAACYVRVVDAKIDVLTGVRIFVREPLGDRSAVINVLNEALGWISAGEVVKLGVEVGRGEIVDEVIPQTIISAVCQVSHRVGKDACYEQVQNSRETHCIIWQDLPRTVKIGDLV